MDAPLIQIRHVAEHAAGAATVHHEDVNDDDIAWLIEQSEKIAVRTWISGANEIGARPMGDSANQALQAFELLVFETLLTRPPFEFVRHPQKYR